jgi:hypothetical protein
LLEQGQPPVCDSHERELRLAEFLTDPSFDEALQIGDFSAAAEHGATALPLSSGQLERRQDQLLARIIDPSQVAGPKETLEQGFQLEHCTLRAPTLLFRQGL